MFVIRNGMFGDLLLILIEEGYIRNKTKNLVFGTITNTMHQIVCMNQGYIRKAVKNILHNIGFESKPKPIKIIKKTPICGVPNPPYLKKIYSKCSYNYFHINFFKIE